MYLGLRFDPSRDNLLSQRDEALHLKLRSRMAPGVCSIQYTAQGYTSSAN